MIEETTFFVLYLFYGLVFFIIGSAITSRDLRFSDLKLARVLWVFALFAYTHGLNEWLVLFMHMYHDYFPGEYYSYLEYAKFILLGTSFGFLFWFGFELLMLSIITRAVLLVIAAFVMFLVVGPFINSVYDFNLNQGEIYIRRFIALPGAVLTGFGFIRYAATIKSLSHRGAKSLKYAGFSTLLYGVFAGAFLSGVDIFGAPIEVCRAIAAFFVLHNIMRALQIFDVERKVKIEDSLKRFAQSEKMISLGKLSAGIAHEINNPLSNVIFSVEMLEKDLKKRDQFDNTFRHRIDGIKRNTERAAKIAGELLFFSHNREIELEPLSLIELIHKTFQLIGSRKNLYDYSFDLGNVPEIDGIPWKIEEVLLNVLMNAMDASPPGGLINVATRIEGDKLCCTIRDCGTGINEDESKFVFDPFFTTKEPGKGTGLGLSICFGIMEMHGGEILINSKKGEGTTVRLLFPLPERAP